jgi:hypothetical protein
MVAASAAILFSRVRFIRNAFDGTGDSRPAPAAESSPYGPDSISESAVDTGTGNLEPDRKTSKPASTPAPRPPADDL